MKDLSKLSLHMSMSRKFLDFFERNFRKLKLRNFASQLIPVISMCSGSMLENLTYFCNSSKFMLNLYQVQK